MKFIPDPRYQLVAARHLTRHKRAAVFMGCGLGKTSSTLLAIDAMLKHGRARGFLILGPLRVVTLTWPDECRKWDNFHGLRIANLRTREGWAMLEAGTADIYLLNYQSLPKLCRWMQTADRLPFDGVVFDESTMVKNPDGKRMKGRKVPVLRDDRNRRIVEVKGLLRFLRRMPDGKDRAADDALVRTQGQILDLCGLYTAEIAETGLTHHLPRIPIRWALTGTPRPNSVEDLFGQFRLLDDGARLGKSLSKFREMFMYPTDYMRYNWAPQAGAEEKIQDRIADITIALKSSDYLDLPDTVFTDIEVPLPATARADYDKFEKELLLLIPKTGEIVVSDTMADLTSKLRQVTGGAVYVEKGPRKQWREIHTAKIDALKKLIREIGEPVLIATAFVHEQERIAEAVPGCQRWDDSLFDAWNRGEVPAIVADPASIGHGLNLQHGGRTVIWFSPTWNGEHYDQMNCRVARKGQTNGTPQVFHLLTPGTMDDAVFAALGEKDSGQRLLMTALSNYRRLTE